MKFLFEKRNLFVKVNIFNLNSNESESEYVVLLINFLQIVLY